MPIFEAALDAGTHYMDMAASLSVAHPTQPFTTPGLKLGDLQFARHEDWERSGRLALVGMGMDPGLSDVFARHARDHPIPTWPSCPGTASTGGWSRWTRVSTGPPDGPCRGSA